MIQNSRMSYIKKIFLEKGFIESPWSSSPLCVSLIKEFFLKELSFLITTEISYSPDLTSCIKDRDMFTIKTSMIKKENDGSEKNVFEGIETFLYNRDSNDFIKEKVLSHIFSLNKKI